MNYDEYRRYIRKAARQVATAVGLAVCVVALESVVGVSWLSETIISALQVIGGVAGAVYLVSAMALVQLLQSVTPTTEDTADDDTDPLEAAKQRYVDGEDDEGELERNLEAALDENGENR